MTQPIPFTGSYSADDVEFLLKPIEIQDTPIHLKETLIQSGQKHYSEMLSHETLPSEDYLRLFYQAMELNRKQLANHVFELAKNIKDTRPDGIALVSLARAGTPVGVLLKHVLKRYFKIDATHYSISIIRDIGIDQNALRYILSKHLPEQLTFIDGWTGKGVISKQLTASLQAFSANYGASIPADLYVLADLSGHAAVAASSEDYLIPSCILNSTVSGLVSRSIYSRNLAHASDYHGCYYYREFTQYDLSKYFITEILNSIEQIQLDCALPQQQNPLMPSRQLQQQSREFLDWITRRFGVRNHHYIKPGIGEATRALLRREAGLLLLNDLTSEATRHLRWLANSKSIPIQLSEKMPYRAAAIIKEVKTTA